MQRGARTACEVALWALAIGCPLALACAPAWATAAALGVSLAALGLARLATRGRGGIEVTFLGAAFLGVVLVAAFQLGPLPPLLIRYLSPTAHDLFSFTVAPLAPRPTWRPASLDPPGTALVLGRLGTALFAYLAAFQIARSRTARRRLGFALATAGTAIAAIGFGHALLGVDRLFGLHAFKFAAPPLLTPFGNPNHLASLLALGALVTLGIAVRIGTRPAVLLLGAAYVAQAAGVFLSLSRGGIVAFLAAHMVFAALFVASRRRERGEPVRLRRTLLVPAAAAVGTYVAAYLAWEALAQELASMSSLEQIRQSKIALVPSMLPMVRDFWLTGVGRGAFEPAFQRYQPFAENVSYSHPENWVLQNMTEMGFVVGGAFVVACVVGWARAAVAWRHSGASLGAIAGAFAVGLHELVDFGTELGGVAVPLAIALALAGAEEPSPERPVAPRRRRIVDFTLAGVAAAAALALPWGAAHTLERDGKRLAAVRSNPVAARALAAELVPLHPADYYLHLVPAFALASQAPWRPKEVLPWANRAMYLNPSAAWPHRLAARCLLALGRPAQARIEYRLAFAAADRADLLREVLAKFRQADELLETVPDEAPAVAFLVDALAGARKHDLAYAVAKRRVERAGDEEPVAVRLAGEARALRRPAEALEIADRVLARFPGSPVASSEKAAALADLGRLEAAVKALETATLREATNAPLLFQLASYLGRLGQHAREREVLSRIYALGPDSSLRAQVLVAEAGAWLAEGNVGRGIDGYRAAMRAQPSWPHPRWALVDILERQGRLAEALAEVQALYQVETPAARPQIDAIRERLATRLEDLERMRRLAPPVPASADPPGP